MLGRTCVDRTTDRPRLPIRVPPLYLRFAALALRRPRTIPHLLGAAWAFRARRWYTRPPFLPLPPRSYLEWRMETAYGDPATSPSFDEMERYLRWTTRMRRLMSERSLG